MLDQKLTELSPNEGALRSEIVRLNKVVEALMDRAERSANEEVSDFSLFQTTIMLEQRVRARTAELEASLAENDRINRELGESEEKFRLLSENASSAIVQANAEGKITYWNPAAERIFGYTRAEILGRNAHATLTPQRYRERAAAGFAHFAKTGLGEVLNTTLEIEALRKDGSEFPVELSVSGVRIRGIWHSIAVIRDITERKRFAAEMEYRSALLHAVSVAAKELLTAPSLENTMATVLRTVGQAARVDRMNVFERQIPSAGTPGLKLRYAWSSPRAPVMLDAAAIINAPDVLADPWFAPLGEGLAISEHPEGMADGPAKSMFLGLGIRAILIVPITVEGKVWGHIGFDDCVAEREWNSAELDILRTVADMIGGAIIRERYIEELKNANTIVESSPTVLFRLGGDPSLPLTYVSHSVSHYGYDPAEMVASPSFWQTIIHPDDAVRVAELLARMAVEGNEPTTAEFRIRSKDGAYNWFECRYSPVRDRAGRLFQIEGLLTNITERKQAADEIILLATTDGLTGLANRATFIERLRQTVAAAKRGAPPFAVLYLDIDRFKDINDTLGHSAGDLLLKSVGERLKGCIRETDLVARLGGDEFAILQANRGDLANSGLLASKIMEALSAPYPLGKTEMRITVSIGISAYAPETVGPDEMLAEADIALYRAKDEGRNQYCFHTDDLDREVHERVTLANDLRQAFERNELELYFQPQVELSTGLIVGMEALIRWNHPRLGLLQPADFLTIIELTPLILTLGQWVLDHACEQMKVWRDAGIALPILAVNLSLKQLQTGGGIVEFVTRTLTKWGLSPEDLELDVSEAMLVYLTLHGNTVLDRLQQLGMKIAIDDFGTQYSSLDYLKTYRVSRVKIPRSAGRCVHARSGGFGHGAGDHWHRPRIRHRRHRERRGDGGATGAAEQPAVAHEGARLLLQRAGSRRPGDGTLASGARGATPR